MINLLTSWLFLVCIQISLLPSPKNKKEKKESEYKCMLLCKSECILSLFFGRWHRYQRGMCCQAPINYSACEGNVKKCKLLSRNFYCQVCGKWFPNWSLQLWSYLTGPSGTAQQPLPLEAAGWSVRLRPQPGILCRLNRAVAGTGFCSVWAWSKPAVFIAAFLFLPWALDQTLCHFLG